MNSQICYLVSLEYNEQNWENRANGRSVRLISEAKCCLVLVCDA